MGWRVLLGVVLLMLASAQTAWAGTLTSGGDVMYYRGGWNEVNTVRITEDALGNVTFRDSTAPLTLGTLPGAADPCVQVDEHTAACGHKQYFTSRLNSMDDFAKIAVNDPLFTATSKAAPASRR